MIFKTVGRGDEKELAWIINHYDETRQHITYLVFTPYRDWTIIIDCVSDSDGKTSAKLTYGFTALDAAGNGINKHHLESMYASNLSDWEHVINRYLGSQRS